MSDSAAIKGLMSYLTSSFRELAISRSLAQEIIEDYTALKVERDALAAENAYLHAEIKQHSQSTHFCEVCGEADPCENDDVCYALNHELPATDEILNDLRADSIEKLIGVLDESGAFTITDVITVMENFAANLRKENGND